VRAGTPANKARICVRKNMLIPLFDDVDDGLLLPEEAGFQNIEVFFVVREVVDAGGGASLLEKVIRR
jgi:hypothetical protein